MSSALAPLHNRTFAVMWAAALISNIGTWMHSVGASWLMTSLTNSPLMVSLVQTATTLPVFLFALPAGALADIYNRRTLLLLSNSAMFVFAIIFSLLVWTDYITSLWLLLFTFLLGAGSAFMAPAWQSVIPRMVSKEELPQAVALGGINVNVSRAIGPALAGLCISAYGMASPFIANAISFIVILLTLLWWKYTPSPAHTQLPPERVWQGMRAGLRYARYSTPLQYTMLHVFGFMFFANAYWGLLPILAREQFGGNAEFFGLLMGSIGIGAVGGAFLLPRLKRCLTPNKMLSAGTLCTALIAASTSYLPNQLVALLSGLIFGLGWIMVLSTLNTSAQQSLPDWVRARGLAVFMMVFFGGMSLGSVFWGWLAAMLDVPATMLTASSGALVFLLVTYRFPLQQGAGMDHTPSRHWPVPVISEIREYDKGPVMVSIRYSVDDIHRQAFLRIMQERGKERRRNGASRWGIFEDTEHHGQFVEFFCEHSWSEHLRHHDRVTATERTIEDQLRPLLTEKPIVSHYLASHKEENI